MSNTPFCFFPIFRAFDTAGNPLAGGLLYTYQAGGVTPLATYSDAAGLVTNTNPVVLDTTGSATVRLKLGVGAYKFVLTDSVGTTQWTEDNYDPVAPFAATTWTGADGTAGAPALSAASDTTTGFYFGTAGQIGVALSGVTGGQIAQGSFTATYTTFSASVSGTAQWQRWGKEVTITLPAGTGTSTAPDFGISGIPAAIQPSTTQWVALAQGSVFDNNSGAQSPAVAVTGGSSTWLVKINGGNGWTPSGTKGFFTATTIKYLLI